MDFKQLYNDAQFPASYTGKHTFTSAVKTKYPTVKNKDVDKALTKIDSYTLHKPTRRPKLFRRIYTKGIGYLYQIDLVDMKSYSSLNNGFNWLITCIDTFSKKAWVFPIKNKEGITITTALKYLLTQNRPIKIEFDQGTEFYNKNFLGLLRKLKIKWYSTYSDRKNAIVERFNRTLKTRMFRAFTARGSHKWIDIIQDLVNGYNKTKHRSIGFAPDDVNKSNEKVVRKKLFPEKNKKLQKPKFKIGDTVRITRKKSVFQKGYEQTYSYEVFEVNEIKNTYPITYGLRDYKGEVIKGSFYASEIQHVDKSDGIWPIERIINTRKRRGITEYLVKFVGYPNEANNWISQADLFEI